MLGVTAIGDSLAEAVNKAYATTEKIEFSNGFYRKDIGKRALNALE